MVTGDRWLGQIDMLGIDDASENISVASLSRLKRDILFFDKIALTNADRAIQLGRIAPGNTNDHRDFSNDLEFILGTPYFEEQKLVGIFDAIDEPNTIIEGDFNEILNTLSESSRKLEYRDNDGRPMNLGEAWPWKVTELSRAEFDEGRRHSALHRSLFLRTVAAKLRVKGIDAVSTYGIPPWTEQIESKLNVTEVLRLVIKRVPVPDGIMPWQDILEMKEDLELADRARKLRLWATKIARSESSLASADEQISDLLSDYSRYLSAHKIKTSSTILESVVVGTAAIFEDLVKLKFEKIAKRFFSYRKFHAEVLLSEMKAPGRELSLVTTLQDRLG